MAQVDTVVLAEGALSPAGKSWHSGYVHQSPSGVEVHSRYDLRGDASFYPWERVVRIDRATGWK
jgi:hypothetical protein